MVGIQVLYPFVSHVYQEMNSLKSKNTLKPLVMIASIAILFTVSLAPVFADSTSTPLAPTNLNAVPVSGNQITLTWNPPVNATQSGVIEYQIQRNGTILVNNTESTLTSYNDTSLFPGDIGQYQVAAWNVAGIGLFSNSASATTILYPSPATTVPAPDNATTPIYEGNWTKYVIIHHGQHGILGNQTFPHFDRTHIGQFPYGRYNGTYVNQQYDNYNGTYIHQQYGRYNGTYANQQNGTFYQIHNPNPIVSGSQQKWNKQMEQFKLNLLREELQHKNSYTGTQAWTHHVFAGTGSHTKTTSSFVRHFSSSWTPSTGTNRVSFTGSNSGHVGDWHKIPPVDWKKLHHY